MSRLTTGSVPPPLVIAARAVTRRQPSRSWPPVPAGATGAAIRRPVALRRRSAPGPRRRLGLRGGPSRLQCADAGAASGGSRRAACAGSRSGPVSPTATSVAAAAIAIDAAVAVAVAVATVPPAASTGGTPQSRHRAPVPALATVAGLCPRMGPAPAAAATALALALVTAAAAAARSGLSAGAAMPPGVLGVSGAASLVLVPPLRAPVASALAVPPSTSPAVVAVGVAVVVVAAAKRPIRPAVAVLVVQPPISATLPIVGFTPPVVVRLGFPRAIPVVPIVAIPILFAPTRQTVPLPATGPLISRVPSVAGVGIGPWLLHNLCSGLTWHRKRQWSNDANRDSNKKSKGARARLMLAVSEGATAPISTLANLEVRAELRFVQLLSHVFVRSDGRADVHRSPSSGQTGANRHLRRRRLRLR
mmetsp:Transcript_51612/g.146156  ORF Transcript_51612/g.146156 Transcript_51612/m.146156 type:complete len:419 (+) Transcript_51612:33-1289(+)